MHIRLTRSKRLYYCSLNLLGTKTLRPSKSGQVRFYIDYSFSKIVYFNPIALSRLNGKKNAIAFPALKGGGFLRKMISDLVLDYSGREFDNWYINTDYHFGGFAKLNKELVEFTKEFEKLNGFELDYIYTNKMMFGIAELIKSGYFKSGETIVAIHSGGLQGNIGMIGKIEKFSPVS